MCNVYVLRSIKTGRRYVGITEDIERRLEEHNFGHTVSTRGGIPWRLIYSEAHANRSLAARRERFLKSGQGRAFLDQLQSQPT